VAAELRELVVREHAMQSSPLRSLTDTGPLVQHSAQIMGGEGGACPP